MGEKNLDEQPLPATTTFYRIVCVPFLVAVRCFADMMLMINCRHIVESCSVAPNADAYLNLTREAYMMFLFFALLKQFKSRALNHVSKLIKSIISLYTIYLW
jgi:hypothetical protein